MKRVVTTTIVVLFASAATAQQGDAPKIEGVWNLTFAAERGLTTIQDKSVHWTIDAKGKVKQHSGPDITKAAPNHEFILTFGKNRTVEYKGAGRTMPGIYEVEDKGDKITFCFNPKGNERPQLIDSNPMYGYTVFRIIRVKKI